MADPGNHLADPFQDGNDEIPRFFRPFGRPNIDFDGVHEPTRVVRDANQFDRRPPLGQLLMEFFDEPRARSVNRRNICEINDNMTANTVRCTGDGGFQRSHVVNCPGAVSRQARRSAIAAPLQAGSCPENPRFHRRRLLRMGRDSRLVAKLAGEAMPECAREDEARQGRQDRR